MRNYVFEGDRIPLAAPRNLASGEGFIVGAIFAVASGPASAAETITSHTAGVFDITKKGTTAFTAGDLVSWDDANYRCDAPAAGFFPIGVAIAAAGAGAGTVRVKLADVPTEAAA